MPRQSISKSEVVALVRHTFGDDAADGLAARCDPAEIEASRREPPILYARSVARRERIERMTLDGMKVREIADELRVTVTHVLRVRAELRAAGRLPETARSAIAKAKEPVLGWR